MHQGEHITNRWLQAQRNIRALEHKYRRRPGSVTLLAASKGHSIRTIERLVQLGQMDFGENYVQEALPKIAACRTRLSRSESLPGGTGKEKQGASWHFIGNVQGNKTGRIAHHFAWVHSIDRARIAQRLSAARPPDLPALNICIQINIGALPTKSGLPPAQLPELVDQARALPGIRVRGLMILPAPERTFAKQCACFAVVREWFETLRTQCGDHSDWNTLSMGTSGDFEAAIANGSTMVRLGTALLGPRPSQDIQTPIQSTVAL